jgi:hypothetical protein
MDKVNGLVNELSLTALTTPEGRLGATNHRRTAVEAKLPNHVEHSTLEVSLDGEIITEELLVITIVIIDVHENESHMILIEHLDVVRIGQIDTIISPLLGNRHLRGDLVKVRDLLVVVKDTLLVQCKNERWNSGASFRKHVQLLPLFVSIKLDVIIDLNHLPTTFG